MVVENGEVVVIRDGDYVEAVFYRKCYDDLSGVIDEVLQYLNEKKFENPNLSYMEIRDGRFVQMESENPIYEEFEEFARIFNHRDYCCATCGALNFVYLDRVDIYCPVCKK